MTERTKVEQNIDALRKALDAAWDVMDDYEKDLAATEDGLVKLCAETREGMKHPSWGTHAAHVKTVLNRLGLWRDPEGEGK